MKNEKEPMVLKLKDWPPGEDFRDMMPSRYGHSGRQSAPSSTWWDKFFEVTRNGFRETQKLMTLLVPVVVSGCALWRGCFLSEMRKLSGVGLVPTLPVKCRTRDEAHRLHCTVTGAAVPGLGVEQDIQIGRAPSPR